MKVFLIMLCMASYQLFAQTAVRSGFFNSTSSKSTLGVPFQYQERLSTPLAPGYGSGFLVPRRSTPTTVLYEDIYTEQVGTYPNPATNTLTLDFPTEVNSIRIFNTEGILIESFQEKIRKTTINTSQYPSGLYRVLAIGEKTKHVSTFIVNK
jgi:hypothetical protein